MTDYVALYGGPIVGEASSQDEAVAKYCPTGRYYYLAYYDADDGPAVQGYEPDGRGLWIIDPVL